MVETPPTLEAKRGEEAERIPDASIARVLAVPGDGVYQEELDGDQRTLTLWVRQVGKRPYYTCRGCGISTAATHGTPGARRVRDLPWGPWTVWLVVEVDTVACRRCGRRREQLPFVTGTGHHVTRFAAAVARDCADAPVRRVAARWGLAAEMVRQLDKRALRRWAAGRARPPLRYLGVDELFLGKPSVPI